MWSIHSLPEICLHQSYVWQCALYPFRTMHRSTGWADHFSFFCAQEGLQTATAFPSHARDSTLFSVPELSVDTFSMFTIYVLSMHRRLSTFLKALVLLWKSKDSLIYPGLQCLGKQIIHLGRWERRDRTYTCMLNIISNFHHLRKLLSRHCENMAFMSFYYSKYPLKEFWQDLLFIWSDYSEYIPVGLWKLC